jgi:hypothetical protein
MRRFLLPLLVVGLSLVFATSTAAARTRGQGPSFCRGGSFSGWVSKIDYVSQPFTLIRGDGVIAELTLTTWNGGMAVFDIAAKTRIHDKAGHTLTLKQTLDREALIYPVPCQNRLEAMSITVGGYVKVPLRAGR